ncbi:MAG: hypothetical protein CMJ18_17115 [Phycisphaeraceae bacterium]|nr:hypothetical protein [Phycisphaeraceae bacterium]
MRRGLRQGGCRHGRRLRCAPTAEASGLDALEPRLLLAADLLAAATFERIGFEGGLIAVSGNAGSIDAADNEDHFDLLAQAGQTISAIATPNDAGAILTIELIGAGGAVTASAPGAAVVLPAQTIGADGSVTLRVAGDTVTTYDLDIHRNAALEAEIGDTAANLALAIDHSAIAFGTNGAAPFRYAVVAQSEPATLETDRFSIDLTGRAGRRIDVILTGLDGADFSSSFLLILDESGTNLASGSSEPLGIRPPGVDLAVLEFVVPSDGIYTMELLSVINGPYALVVTDGAAFDVEPNNTLTDPRRDITNRGALGMLGEDPTPPAPAAGDEHASHVVDDVPYIPPKHHLTDGADAAAPGLTPIEIADRYLREHAEDLGLAPGDLDSYAVINQYESPHTGVTHLYLRQVHRDLEVRHAEININVTTDGRVLNVGSSFITGLQEYEASTEFVMSPLAAFEALSAEHGWSTSATPSILPVAGPDVPLLLDPVGVSFDPIPARLEYVPTPDGGIEPAWSFVVRTTDGDHWLDTSVHAHDGDLLQTTDWASHARYRVFEHPLNSPDEGPRTLVVDPQDPVASPLGWHDVNLTVGAGEFTDTRGNNVLAQEDRNANNSGGFRPSGGAALDFDFPIDLALDPPSYESAAITNVFYLSNLLHDVFFHYGFDEAAGNFQQTNFSGVGAGNDAVRADVQDGSGVGNANFSTPPDGIAPRMQMFEWIPGPFVQVSAPVGVAGDYVGAPAAFGPALAPAGVTGELVLVEPVIGCDPLTNGAQASGRIAVVDRGTCTFVTKVRHAQDAGAIGVIVIDSSPGRLLIQMDDDGTGGSITIPSVFMRHGHGEDLKAALATDAVTATLTSGGLPNRDSGLDNGIVIHEYAHGVSTRLTGGPSSVNTLISQHSSGMNEGWSDFFALMLTQNAADAPLDQYPLSAYLLGEPADGGGIRNFPYSFDPTVNPLTFEDIATLNRPHGIGEVWASALWDLNWLLIDGDGASIPALGFDPDLVGGTSGNNLALQLVMDALKLQPSNPSILEGRDAILLADQALTGGVNQRAIWTAFARRGMGLSAVDGSNPNNLNVTEAFDLPEFSLVGPGVTDVDPPSGPTEAVVTELTVDFSETLDAISAADPANYQLLRAGPDDQFSGGAGDDVTIALTPVFDGDRQVVLQIDPAFAPLDPDQYRLTLDGDGSILDLDGNPLNSTTGPGGGSDTVHDFEVTVSLDPSGDLYQLVAEAGEMITVTTATVFDDAGITPINDLDPELIVISPESAVAGHDTDGLDGKNAVVSFIAAEAGTYLVQVIAESGRGEYVLETSVREIVGPRVTEVLATGTTWSGAFLDRLAADGLGVGGLRIDTGSTAQFDPVPYPNVDRLIVRFDEDVTVAAGDVQVVDALGSSVSFDLAYDQATTSATLTFPQAFGPERLSLSIFDTTSDIVGNALDGEWTDGVSTVSGDGGAGGDFTFSLNVLPGDLDRADETVGTNDLQRVLVNFTRNVPIGDTFQGDVTGAAGSPDGVVGTDDVSLVLAFFTNVLPPAAVRGANPPAALSTSLARLPRADVLTEASHGASARAPWLAGLHPVSDSSGLMDDEETDPDLESADPAAE